MPVCYINKEPRNSVYYQLLEFITKVCIQFSFVIYDDNYKNENFNSLINELKPFFIETKKQKGWPGTEYVIYGDQFKFFDYVFVNYYYVDKESIEILKKHSNRLFIWSEKYNLPSDLCFYKQYRNEWLIMTSHENIGVINCNDNELYQIRLIRDLDIHVENNLEKSKELMSFLLKYKKNNF